MSSPLLRIGFRYVKQHGLQSVLLIFGVAIGVAVIIAVDLANRSATRSFRLSVESLTGRATHQVVGGPSGLDENLYVRLRVEPGMKKIAPVVHDYVTVIQLNRRPMQLVGLDPFAEPPFRSYVANQSGATSTETLNTFLTEPNSVLMSEDLARRAGLTLGGTLTLERGPRTVEVRIAGLLKPIDDISRQALSGLLIADISTAQEVLNQIGRLSRIDLIIDATKPDEISTLDRMRKTLPRGASLERPETRNAAIEEISNAFNLNLFALSLLALMVGVFLIYNTAVFSIVQRRTILGTLRALGVTRRQIFGMVVLEILVLGAVGTAFGLGLGIILGKGLLHFVSRTINDLYLTLTVSDFSVSPESVLKGVFTGISVAAVSALIPAWEATRIAPYGVLRRSELEGQISRVIPWISLAGLALCGFGTLLLLLPSRLLEISFAAIFAILLGAAMLVPIGTTFLMRLFMPITGKLAGVIGRVAPRNIVRSQSRTAAAIAALMIAVSVIVGVDIMIGSFRKTVVDWLDTTLTADIFVTTPSGKISSNEGFDPSISKEIARFPGIRSVATARRVQMDTTEYGRINLVAVTEDISVNRRFVWTEGDTKNIWKEMEKGAVLVSEPFAYRNRIPSESGTAVELPADKGTHLFKVAGIYYDYASQNGVVLMSDSVYRKFWDDSQITSIAAYVAPGYNVGSVVQNIQASLAGPHGLILQSNRDLRLSALNVFDRTFTITTALRLLVVIVAFIGVFSTLMALQLERTREIGVLRATGMTVSQVWRMVLLETGLIGLTAGLTALPVGVVLSLILVYVINLRSFGWTLEFILRPEYFLEALLIAVFAAILAGVYPAFRFGRTKIASAIRAE